MTTKSKTAKTVSSKPALSAKTQARLNALRNAPPRTAQIKHSTPTTPFNAESLLALLRRDDMNRSVGELLREARKARKLTARELAVRIDLSQPRVTTIENATTELTLETLTRLASGLSYRVLIQLIPEDQDASPLGTLLPAAAHKPNAIRAGKVIKNAVQAGKVTDVQNKTRSSGRQAA
jgi:HTH-type transcriptional regulator / antitoxin HipB